MPEYEVVIVKYGTRRAVKSEVYLNHHVYGEADGPVDMDYFFWVVRNHDTTVVVDTGFSAAGGAARRRRFLLDPAHAFDLVGVDRDAGPTVVVTHAHYDHIGNLALFPCSPLVVAEREYAFWTGPYRGRTVFHHSVEDDELAHLEKANAEERVTFFRDQHQVAPGIELIEIGGHTPGQCAVLVQTAEGPVLLASDAIHYYEELEKDRPFAVVADVPEMYAGFETVRGMLADGTVRHLVTGHDPQTLDRFTPLDGELTGLAATIGALA